MDNTLDGLVAKRADLEPNTKRYQTETEAIELPDDELEAKVRFEMFLVTSVLNFNEAVLNIDFLAPGDRSRRFDSNVLNLRLPRQVGL